MQKGRLLVMANKKRNKLLKRRIVTVRSSIYRMRAVSGTMPMSMKKGMKKQRRSEENMKGESL
jgi:hypothetical protein